MDEDNGLEFEAGYNLRARHADYEQFVTRWAVESTEARSTHTCEIDIPYGDGPGMTLDIFPAQTADAPIFVFIHGGYWRAMDKDHFSFPANAFVPAGCAVASINYALAPSVTVGEITEQCRTAAAWIYDNAARFNGDADRIHVSGHSAGGHLTAALASTDWTARGKPAYLIKSGIALSGVFDLRPIMQTSLNEDVRLDQTQAEQESPLLHLPARGVPMIVAVGAGETEDFIIQSRDYAAAYQRAGFNAELQILEGFHHFDIVLELGRDSPLTRSTLKQMGVGTH